MRTRSFALLASILALGCFNPSHKSDLSGSTDETTGGAASSIADGSTSNEATSGHETSPGETSSPDSTSGHDDSGGEVSCDPVTHSCEEGEKCQPYPDADSICVPAPSPSAKVGETCFLDQNSGIDNCEHGSLCWNTRGNGSGTCVALCDTDEPHCPSPEDGCGLPWFQASVGACLPLCDPLTMNCNDGQGCYAGLGSLFVCLPAPLQGGAYGSACTHTNTCASGLLCAEPAAVPACDARHGCCTQFCDLTSSEECQGHAAGQLCVPYFEDGHAPPGYEGVGICSVP
jgi:hypothetical protein